MVFKKLFGRDKEEPDFDPTNVSLLDLEMGYVLDYDLKTWEVVAHYEYDWGDGYVTDEFKIQASNEALYLHVEEDDELEISISKKLRLNAVEEKIVDHFQDTDDPPRRLTYQGVAYEMEEEALAHFRTVGKEHWSELISWDYMHPDDDDLFLTLERWGEEEFELSHGTYVEDYKFSNILPA